MVTVIGFVVGGAVGVKVGSGSVKEETSEFQNAIFSGSIFFLTEDVRLNEIYSSSLRVYAGQVFESSVGFLHQIYKVHTKFYCKACNMMHALVNINHLQQSDCRDANVSAVHKHC